MSTAAALPAPQRRRLLLRLIVATIVGILLFGVCIPFALTSFMMFDAGETTAAWIAFAAAWLVPLAIIVGLVVAWICFALRTNVGAYIGLGIATLPVAVAVVLFALLFAGQI